MSGISIQHTKVWLMEGAWASRGHRGCVASRYAFMPQNRESLIADQNIYGFDRVNAAKLEIEHVGDGQPCSNSGSMHSMHSTHSTAATTPLIFFLPTVMDVPTTVCPVCVTLTVPPTPLMLLLKISIKDQGG